MINSMQIAIMKKDLWGLVFNKRLFPVLLIVPLVFTVVMPTIFIMVIHFAPDEMNQIDRLLELLPMETQGVSQEQILMGLIFNSILPIFFMIIPIMTATVMAASSFVGEKEKRTLETLLYCPLSLRQIFQSKILASFILSMLVSLGSFLVMLLAVELEVLLTTGSLLLPNANWLVIMLLISPSISLIAITLIVRGSAKSQTMEEAQQRAVFLILPILLLVIGQFTGLFLINWWLLLGLGAAFSLIAALLLRRGIGRFDYESLLR